MTNTGTTTPEDATPPAATPADATPDAPRGRQADMEAAAVRVGGILGRLARHIAANARPEAERALARARAAAEAARPHLGRAAAQAADFAKEYDAELRRVAGAGARIATDRIVPPLLRPIIDAAREEIGRDAGSGDVEARDAAAADGTLAQRPSGEPPKA
ncbi:MAG: hypothetical protein EXR64_02460 [Dehalococcoidia bacterium]|nr:hypothetical protein [Dehalococcoidia bacterium]